ncbi:MAG TPA: VanZ family protein [Patescibacteria group bacterium]
MTQENQKKAVSFIRFWVPVFVWIVIIYSFSSRTMPSVGPTYITNFAAKKTAHVLEYSVLSILLYRALINYGFSKTTAFIWAVSFCFIYGASDEYHQTFTPGREPRIRDVFIDTIGGSVGLLIIWKLLPLAPGRLKNWAIKLDLV